MKNPYLVQRGTIKKDVTEIVNFDSLVTLDYMGVAEFESGALPASLKRIRSYRSLSYTNMTFKDSQLTVLHPAEYFDIAVVQDNINKIATRMFRTKCGSQFPETVNPTPSDKKWQVEHPPKFNFWWDIENDVMFWLSDEQFENNIKKVL